MSVKRIGLLFGMEDTFPWALIEAVKKKGGGKIEAAPVEISCVHDNGAFPYQVVLDRISHEVPFYRTWLKCAVARGVRVVNNPFWGMADDKFFDNLVATSVGVAVPKTILLPHKNHPPNTGDKTFRNMRFVNWDEVYAYLGFPIFLKPAYGGGWRDVYKCNSPEEVLSAYDCTRDLAMMAQEAIEFTEYYRCYVIGRSRVHIMPYDPRQPFHQRYIQPPPPVPPAMHKRVTKDALALCRALGYDLNTVEFAVRAGVPYAIDFMNSAPDADLHSVGKVNFDWVVDNMSDVLIEMVKSPGAFEPVGTWPQSLLRTGV